MKLYEHETKKIFEARGIPVPEQYGVIRSPGELKALRHDFSKPVMLKALVLAGGRGKAGGIKKAAGLKEAQSLAEELFRLKIKGYPVDMILVEEAVEATGSCYIGATMDPSTFNNVVIVSASGGVEIETVARERPEALHRLELTQNESELPEDSARELAAKLARDLERANPGPLRYDHGDIRQDLEGLISALYDLYQAADARLCEINPLIITPGGPVAADAKLILDDNALFRQAKLLEDLGIKSKRHDVAEPTANERRAQQAGFPYVDLLSPDAPRKKDKIYVGLVPGGAGYGIFSIDEVVNTGERFFGGKVVPVNFLDSGGGPSETQVAGMFHLLMDYDKVDLIITSRFGGVSSCDVFIRGLIRALRERYGEGKRIVPVYGRMVGTDLPGAREYLEKAKRETPEPLKKMTIIVGNQKIMADVIKEGLAEAFRSKREN